jgi:hypothetical protein
MAHALAESHREAGVAGHLYSLEAIPKFHENVEAVGALVRLLIMVGSMAVGPELPTHRRGSRGPENL